MARTEKTNLVMTGDDPIARLKNLREDAAQCGELREFATTAIDALAKLPRVYTAANKRLEERMRDHAIGLAAAHDATREETDRFGTSYASREMTIAATNKRITANVVRKLQDEIGAEMRETSTSAATAAQEAIRRFGTEIAIHTDRLLVPPMNRSIERIMNEESARLSWRARPNAMVEARNLYMRLIERGQDDEAIDLEAVLAPICAEVRDTPPLKLAARKSSSRPTVTDEDRTIAIGLLARFDHERRRRLPQWLHASTFVHAQCGELFALLAGWHGRFVSFNEYMQRHALGADRDPLAPHPAWIWRGAPGGA